MPVRCASGLRSEPADHHYACSPHQTVRSTLPVAACLLLYYLPTEVTVVPLDGEICSNLGSIKGVKEEEDLCFWSVLLAD